MPSLLVADFTRCFPNTETQSLSSLRTYMSATSFSQDTLVPVIRDDQTALSVLLKSESHLRRVPTTGHAEQAVRNLIAECASAGHRKITVVSYNGILLQSAQQTGSSHDIIIVTKSFSNLCGVNASYSWRFDHISSLDDAVETLRAGLASHRVGSVRKTDIRALLAQQDERFDFRGNAAASGTTGMVSMLLHEAQKRGIIRLEETTGPNPWVQLVRSSKHAAIASPRPISDGTSALAAPVEDRHSRDDVPPLPAPTKSSAEPRLAVVDESAVEAETTETEHRSRRMEQKIREANMGPFVTCRLACYASIEELDLSTGSYSLSALIQHAIAGARQKLQDGEETRENYESQPWRRMGSFLHTVLTRAGAVLDGDGPLADSILSQRKTVTGLSENWKTRADSQILIPVIRSMDDITLYDLPNLAGALYHDRGDEGQAQVLRCLEFLINEGLVTEVEVDGTRFLRLRSPDSSNSDESA